MMVKKLNSVTCRLKQLQELKTSRITPCQEAIQYIEYLYIF